MKTASNSRIVRNAASLVASLLITFTGLQLISGYALPQQAAAGDTQLAAASSPSVR